MPCNHYKYVLKSFWVFLISDFKSFPIQGGLLCYVYVNLKTENLSSITRLHKFTGPVHKQGTFEDDNTKSGRGKVLEIFPRVSKNFPPLSALMFRDESPSLPIIWGFLGVFDCHRMCWHTNCIYNVLSRRDVFFLKKTSWKK